MKREDAAAECAKRGPVIGWKFVGLGSDELLRQNRLR